MMIVLLFWGCVLAADETMRQADINIITFVSGYMTTGRRAAAIPQLECTGSYCADFLKPKTVQCHNFGFDGAGVRWRCFARLEDGIEFSSTEVSCEGASAADDPIVLAGSCGLLYELAPVIETYSEERTKYIDGLYTYGKSVAVGLVIAAVILTVPTFVNR
jgi:hypothetical protein